MPNFQPFNYGNVLAQGENILNAREQRNPNSLQNQLLAAKIKSEGVPDAATYGKQVQYTMDENNNLHGFAVGDDGSLKELPLPPGMKWADTYTAKDMGGYLALLGKRGGFQGSAPNVDLGDIPQTGLPPQQSQPLSIASNPYAPVTKTLPPEKEVDYIEEAKGAAARGTNTANIDSDTGLGKVEEVKALGKEKGSVKIDIARMQSKLPGLKKNISKLWDLADKATYTKAGLAYDETMRQFGKSTEGAVARAKFISMIANQVLPLLRETFGAAFTAAEGNSLKDSLSSPDSSPAERRAQLTAFIDQKVKNIEAKEAQLDAMTGDEPNNDPLGLRQ